MNPASDRRPIRPYTYLFFLLLFASVALLLHSPFLALPYYWDELGQFVPAALDLFHSGAWIPHSTVPNVHPPALMAYLAAFWHLAGYSLMSTRIAMVLLGSVSLFTAFLLAIELCRNARGVPAFLAAALLCVSPLFFAQAMLAQLDMPAMLLASAALLLFLQEKLRMAAAVCVVLVLVKETGLLIPFVFVAWLLYEKRPRDAVWFLLPVLFLGAWIALLARATGHLFGNTEFAGYNLYYPLHPVRIAFALGRRLYYLFFQDFHWIGTIAILYAWRRGSLFTTRAWKIAWLMVAVHVLFLSLVGGAMLERYLLPVLPVVYAAMAAAFVTEPRPTEPRPTEPPPTEPRPTEPRPTEPRPLGSGPVFQTVLLAGLIAGNFWNPPYPFPLDNNLAFTDYVELQQAAAKFVEQNYPGARIVTAWPLSSALRRPEFGYVSRPLAVRGLADFTAASVDAVDWNSTQVFVLFSDEWQPKWTWTNFALVRELRRRYYGYRPGLSMADMQSRPVMPVAGWTRSGLWIEVYEVSSKSQLARVSAP